MAPARLLVIGGSDGGIGAALRAREVAPDTEVTVVVADRYPNFSICGIPYFLSGEVSDWRSLAHRTVSELEQTGMRLLLDTTATRIDANRHEVAVDGPDGSRVIGYDKLVVATGAVPAQPPIEGLDRLGPPEGVHLLHSMDDTFLLAATLARPGIRSVVVVGAGYIGLELADALTVRGMLVTQIEALPEVPPTVDADLGALVRSNLEQHGVEVVTATAVRRITRDAARLAVETDAGSWPTDAVVVVTGVKPDTGLLSEAGAALGARGAVRVDERMKTNLADVFAAGDCVVTHHRLLGETYVPLGTTAHKQGRVAGENAVGGDRMFAGSLGTQVVKVFELATARTGLRDTEAATAGYDPVTVAAEIDDHKAYYPGAEKVHVRITGDRRTGRLIGVQMLGPIKTQVAKRIDTASAALFHQMTVDEISDLDLSYTPPLGSPWDALQTAAQSWISA